MTIKICDITGERNAETLVFETEKTQIDPATAKTEYVEDSVDLSRSGAMILLQNIVRYMCCEKTNKEAFATLVSSLKGKKK